MRTTASVSSPEVVDAFAERLFLAGLGALELLNVELGCRLGLYRQLAGGEAHSPAELTAASGIHHRYAREWLEQAAWTRPAFLHHLTQTWHPAVPAAHEPLRHGTARHACARSAAARAPGDG